jgi:hypothetical protein
MVNDFWAFGDTYGHDENAGDGFKNKKPVKLSNEYGTYTYIKNGEIRPGNEAFQGSWDAVSYDIDNRGGMGPRINGATRAGKAHIHTDVGASVSYLGTSQAGPSSGNGEDLPNSKQGKYFNVVISTRELWIYKQIGATNVKIRINRNEFKPLTTDINGK